MGNASQQRLVIPEHTGGEVNAPRQQAGEGKFCLVRMKGLANFQEFLVFENDNGSAGHWSWGCHADRRLICGGRRRETVPAAGLRL
jgi:hypothetical protein